MNQGAPVKRKVEGGAEKEDNHPLQPNTFWKCGEEEEPQAKHDSTHQSRRDSHVENSIPHTFHENLKEEDDNDQRDDDEACLHSVSVGDFESVSDGF